MSFLDRLLRRQPAPETRSFPIATGSYIESRRDFLSGGAAAGLSATVALASGVWSRSFAMLTPTGGLADLLSPDVLAAIGQDLALRGESVWHLGVDRGDAVLRRASAWDRVGDDRWHVHIPHPHRTETVRALGGEVVSLAINSDPNAPWQGRSPLRMMGASPAIAHALDSALADASGWAGRGVLTAPSGVPEDQTAGLLGRIKAGSMAMVRSKSDLGHHTGGVREEWRRIEMTPDLRGLSLPDHADRMHRHILSAYGIPPSLWTDQGNAGSAREAYRQLALNLVEPLARMILPELRAKLGVDMLNTDRLMAADTAGRVRSVKGLVDAGAPLPEALRLCGWRDVDLSAAAPVQSIAPAGGADA